MQHHLIFFITLYHVFTNVNAVSLPLWLSPLFHGNSTINPLNGASIGRTYGAICDKPASGDFRPPHRSCEYAWQKLQRSTEQIVYTSREAGKVTEGMQLPFRYLSDDGQCAMDIVPRFEHEHTRVMIDGLNLSDYAGAVLVNCVYRQNAGGYIRVPTAKYKADLLVAFHPYMPHVECQATARRLIPDEASCSSALAHMPATQNRIQFGTEPHQEPVPQQFHPPLWEPQKCQVVVGKTPPGDAKVVLNEETWFNIWAAGVAVNTMCVKRGLAGTAKRLGNSEDMTVTLKV